jgi:hypothetical protein
MSTYQAKKRGSIDVEGVNVPFEKGMNVTALSEQISPAVLSTLIGEGIWADVTVEIKEAEKVMASKLKDVEKAKKAKVKK